MTNEELLQLLKVLEKAKVTVVRRELADGIEVRLRFAGTGYALTVISADRPMWDILAEVGSLFSIGAEKALRSEIEKVQ